MFDITYTGSQTFKLQIVSLRIPHHVDRLMSCYGGNKYINCVYEFIQMICGKFRRERPHNPSVTPPQNHHKMAAVPGSCHRAQSALLYCSRDAPGGSSITAGIRALNKHVKPGVIKRYSSRLCARTHWYTWRKKRRVMQINARFYQALFASVETWFCFPCRQT